MCRKAKGQNCTTTQLRNLPKKNKYTVNVKNGQKKKKKCDKAILVNRMSWHSGIRHI